MALVHNIMNFPPSSRPVTSVFVRPRKIINYNKLSRRLSSQQQCIITHEYDQLQQYPTRDFSAHYEQRLEDVRRLLEIDLLNDESLILVDAIQRLGISRHYKEEIHAIIEQHHLMKTHGRRGTHKFEYCRSLRNVSLSFRLLRQQGYHVSAAVSKTSTGILRGTLKQDIKGLLELFEATHVSFEGEIILDRAQDFSRQHLANVMDHNKYWSNIVRTRLMHPYQKSIPRMMERNFISGDFYCMNNVWGSTLWELAEMDLLVGRCVYQEELARFSKWWSSLGLTEELKLARSQPLKWYTWSMALLMDHLSLSQLRLQISKSIAFIYIIDDIFDLYGTPHELSAFTDAIDKWDYASINMLPNYMKSCYKALLDTTNEISKTVYEKYGYDPINDLKQTWKDLCRAFLVEAKWFGSGDWPGPEEYLDNGKVSSGVHVVLVHLFHLLGLGTSRAHRNGTYLKALSTVIISCVATILRLWDDLGSAKDEYQNGNDGSYVEYYMREHSDLTRGQAREHVINMIESEWKILNKACFDLDRSSPSLIFQEASLNLARMVPLMYGYDENQRLPILHQFLEHVLFVPTS
ncbi:S-(+)-linalool synthase- chloroplastic [Striga hermonthica]|uniref:S-(+)-linalool synthase- chloroplastic n=1 Tax=Striga hermonthica TaxID=68872 RepID=A0A9N7N8Q0_STRHE|nr:S-(+)-linalool synthase- chloroplastic [Striga hermonthica]